jgi:hypothetical protein
MEYYAGIDVSLESSSICVVDASGRIVRGAKITGEPEALPAWCKGLGFDLARIGSEAGPLWQMAVRRHEGSGAGGTRNAFKIMPVKTDRRDTRDIAQLIRMAGSVGCIASRWRHKKPGPWSAILRHLFLAELPDHAGGEDGLDEHVVFQHHLLACGRPEGPGGVRARHAWPASVADADARLPQVGKAVGGVFVPATAKGGLNEISEIVRGQRLGLHRGGRIVADADEAAIVGGLRRAGCN